MTSISSLISQILDFPPSCISFCPTQPEIFVVGTYFLHKDENQVVNGKTLPWQKRSGSLVLFRLEDDDDVDARLRIHELSALKTDFAVLDVQWSPHRSKGHEALAVATSSPMIEFYSLDFDSDGKSAKLRDSSFLSLEDTDLEVSTEILTLSVAWHPSRKDLLAVTLSNGAVQYCQTEGDFAELNHNISVSNPEDLKHDLEAWTAAFSPSSMGVFSGGDDCALQYLRPTETVDGIEASWQDRKLHGAGVTAILPLSDDLVITGSYDDHIRLIFVPKIGRRQVLADQNLEGGVWRLKMIEQGSLRVSADEKESPSSTCTILASCMHAGSRILRLQKGEDGTWQFDVIAQFTEHQSMNYGSDIQPLHSEDRKARTVISTSFYDKLLCVWKVDLDGRPALAKGAES